MRLEHGDLISTIALGLTLAFLVGFVARRLGLPSMVGGKPSSRSGSC